LDMTRAWWGKDAAILDQGEDMPGDVMPER
jgi:hypothetical protein